MPEKITSKNLSYSQNLPPFLARLHGQQTSNSGPDPILAGRRRAVKPRDDAEDAPVVLDEDGNVLDDVQLAVDGSAVRAAVAVDGDGASGGGEETNKQDGKEDPDSRARQKVLGSRKRKAVGGKVIGGGDDDQGSPSSKDAAASDRMRGLGSKSETQKQRPVAPSSKSGIVENTTKPLVKGKKKAKKIKLSFGDDEE